MERGGDGKKYGDVDNFLSGKTFFIPPAGRRKGKWIIWLGKNRDTQNPHQAKKKDDNYGL